MFRSPRSLFPALRDWCIACGLALTCLPATAGWVNSAPGKLSLALRPDVQAPGQFHNTFDFTLNDYAEVTYATHRFTFTSTPFNDFNATLFRVLADDSLSAVATGADSFDARRSYPNTFYINSLAAGDYQLRIDGMDPYGLGYDGTISVFSSSATSLAGLRQSVPEPTTLALILAALLSASAAADRKRVLRLHELSIAALQKRRCVP